MVGDTPSGHLGCAAVVSRTPVIYLLLSEPPAQLCTPSRPQLENFHKPPIRPLPTQSTPDRVSKRQQPPKVYGPLNERFSYILATAVATVHVSHLMDRLSIRASRRSPGDDSVVRQSGVLERQHSTIRFFVQNHMSGRRLEVADVFHAHQNQFLQRWGMLCRTSNGRCCAILACAERLRSALISNDAIAAVMRLSLTTRAATGTVPSVSPRLATAGS
jgi:hypothetical protein